MLLTIKKCFKLLSPYSTNKKIKSTLETYLMKAEQMYMVTCSLLYAQPYYKTMQDPLWHTIPTGCTLILTSSSLISFSVYETTVIPIFTRSDDATSNTCLLNFFLSL
jgi:hypothetical protein